MNALCRKGLGARRLTATSCLARMRRTMRNYPIAVLSVLLAAGSCGRRPSHAAPLASWEPVDPGFRGCAGG